MPAVMTAVMLVLVDYKHKSVPIKIIFKFRGNASADLSCDVSRCLRLRGGRTPGGAYIERFLAFKPDLDAPVHVPARGGAVVGQGVAFAQAAVVDALWRDASCQKLRVDRLGSLL